MATQSNQTPANRTKQVAMAAKGSDVSLADGAYERILSMIVGGEISIGEKLPTEHQLSDQFGMSRPVLRQALRQLREDDLIVSRQGSGSYVKKRPDVAILNFADFGSIADIQRTFEFRTALEGEAAFLAAARRTDKDLKTLLGLLQKLDAHMDDGILVDLDDAFHVAICVATDNPYFANARTSMTQVITAGMELTRNLSFSRPQERTLEVQNEHYAIYHAIKAQNSNAARDHMRRHIERSRHRIYEGAPN